MGVTKVLMASNDTLFNFEDTLGDRDDMLSPRINSGGSIMNANGAATPQPDNCKTPTNEAYLQIYPVEYKPNDVNTDTQLGGIRPNTLQFTPENLTNNLNDLLSPEQQKTFSEEINTIEQLSSDLSATIDATNTLDDLKTCISVHLIDDANNSKIENSENDPLATEQYKTHAMIISESVTEATAQSSAIESITPRAQSPNVDEQILRNTRSEIIQTESPFNSIEPNENVKENKNSTDDNNEDADTNGRPETIQIGDKCENQNQSNELNVSHDSAAHLSGEEDPWVRLFSDAFTYYGRELD